MIMSGAVDNMINCDRKAMKREAKNTKKN